MDSESLQAQKFDLILTDNPFRYDNQQQNKKSRGGITYPTLTMKELYDLEISKIANDNSILVSWCMLPKLMDEYYESYSPLSIIRKWGFRPVTALFVWIKTNKRGAAIYEETNLEEYNDYYSGLGRYTNSNAEIAIVARRGKGLERKAKDVKQLIFSPIRAHSEKPREQYERLSKLYGDDIDRIELFARKQNAPPNGWKATGLDYDGVDIRNFLKGYN